MTLIKVKTRGTDNVSSRKNLLINGGMLIDQRQATMQFNASSNYRCDRWYQGVSGGGTFQFTHSDDAPAGFGKSIKIQCTTADTSLDAGAYGYIMHKLEGNALQSMNSTNGIVEHTISFYAKASKTGVYTVNLRDEDNAQGNSKTFTINSADTWERYTLTFPAHSSGTLDNDNLSSYRLYWWFASGTNQTSGTFYNGTWGSHSNPNRVSSSNVNLGDSTSNNFYITGIQMEVGDSASDFEHRSFDEELILCQRYYQKSYVYETAPGTATQHGSWSTGGHQGGTSTAYVEGVINFERLMRATPTLTLYDHNGNSNKCARLATGVARYQNESINTSQLNARGVTMYSTTGTAAGIVQGHYTVSAEL